jgi:hypothetical protein
MIETSDRSYVRDLTYIQWGPVIAGAISAAALATVLHAFAAAIGLAVSSTAPTWRDSSMGLFILSGVYLLLVALASYGFGGYVAGLLRERIASGVPAHETELRDNLHGLLVWAVATLITASLLAASAATATRLAAPSGENAGPASSVAGENIIAFDVDRVLRGDRRPDESGDIAATRAEISRILLTSSNHSGVAAEDRNYLARLISTRTGLSQPEAERRADSAIASAKENLRRGRRSATILAFMVGAAALLGAVAAWFAAAAGGQHRDEASPLARRNVLGRRQA